MSVLSSDLLAELSDMPLACEPVVLNPFDRRSVAWNIAADVRTPTEARHFVESLFPPVGGDETNNFFSNAARAIIAGVIESLNRNRAGKWTLYDIVRITATRDRLKRI